PTCATSPGTDASRSRMTRASSSAARTPCSTSRDSGSSVAPPSKTSALGARGSDAEATRQVTRGPYRKRDPLWQVKAREEGRLRIDRRSGQAGASAQPARDAALDAWKKIAL